MAFVGYERIKNIRAGNSLLDRNTDQPCDPDNRHAVRQTKIAPKQRFPEVRIRLAIDKEVQVWR